MAAGEWEYIGVESAHMQDGDDYRGQDMYLLEAHRHRRQGGNFVRLRIYARWVQEYPQSFETLRVIIDGAAVESGRTVERFVIADSDLLRGVPFRRLFSQASTDLMRLTAVPNPAPEGSPSTTLPDMVKLRGEWPKGDTREVAKWAAVLYGQAVEDRNPATRAVQDAFNVSRSTAKRMIDLARELGFLADDVVGAPVPSRKRKEPHHEQGKD